MKSPSKGLYISWKTHAYLWLFYFVMTYVLNIIGTPNINLTGLVTLFALYVGTFYLLVYTARRFTFFKGKLKFALSTLLVFCGLVIATYLLVYKWLPKLDVQLALTDKEFSIGKLIQSVYRNFQPALLGAIAYRLGAEGQKNKMERLRIEQQKQEIENENRYLKIAALGKQLESHWFHAIFNSVYAKVAHNDKLANLMQSLITLLKYYFNNFSLKSRLVMLEKEVNHIANLITLNEVAEPNAVPVKWVVEKPLYARQIPPLILGTIVENAFKYADQEDLDNPIRITLSSTAKRLTFTCNNKISRVARKQESHKLGLANISRQLELIEPGRNELTVRDDGVSFHVSLTIYYENL